MRFSILFIFALAAIPAQAAKVQTGAYAEGYYSFAFNQPANFDRSYTTHAARHNEFNVNLAYLEALVNEDKVRGRIALQVGTSVHNNYSGEPTIGSVSGPTLARHIQEAKAGYKMGENTWLDGGIFFAHVGAESWISRDNLTLTRSLVADYSPYYLSGVKLTHDFSQRFSAQLLVVNGWQIISENNKDKSVGTSLSYSFDRWSVAYNTMAGQEVSPADVSGNRFSRFRHFHDFIIRSTGSSALEWAAQFDLGFQRGQTTRNFQSWYGSTLMARFRVADKSKLALRGEYFRDPNQLVIATGVAPSAKIFGASLGYDQELASALLWRTEYRFLSSTNQIFPKRGARGKSDSAVTTSLALSI